MSEKPLLDEKQLARTLNISVASARRWRLLNQGPKFLKIGASVRYRPEDVDGWLASRPAGGEVIFEKTAEIKRKVGNDA
jgi:predicted DNA-binding transcriptional regulator AlpA